MSQKKHADPWRRQVAELKSSGQWDEWAAGQRQERAREHAEYVAALHTAASPLFQALVNAGAPDPRVAGLPRFSAPNFSTYLPILHAHLHMNYGENVLSLIVGTMATPLAVAYRLEFMEMFIAKPRAGTLLLTALANAINNTTTSDTLFDTVKLLKDRSLGPSRLVLLHALSKSRSILAANTIEELREDPDFAIELPHWTRRRNATS